MIQSELQSLAIEGVAAKLGLQLEKRGAGLAGVWMEQDLLPFSINLDAHTIQFENGNEGGPIEFVMAVRGCTGDEAIKWLRKESEPQQRKIKQIGQMTVLDSSIV